MQTSGWCFHPNELGDFRTMALGFSSLMPDSAAEATGLFQPGSLRVFKLKECCLNTETESYPFHFNLGKIIRS